MGKKQAHFRCVSFVAHEKGKHNPGEHKLLGIEHKEVKSSVKLLPHTGKDVVGRENMI